MGTVKPDGHTGRLRMVPQSLMEDTSISNDAKAVYLLALTLDPDEWLTVRSVAAPLELGHTHALELLSELNMAGYIRFNVGYNESDIER